MTTINEVADYIIVKTNELSYDLNILKLHKLAYYAQAWHLALTGGPLFDGKFQAWIHGPISRSLFDRFSASHIIYEAVSASDVRPNFILSTLPEAHRHHLDEVIAAYAHLHSTQLNQMVRAETPWISARGGARPTERCETEIDEEIMRKFYKGQLKHEY